MKFCTIITTQQLKHLYLIKTIQHEYDPNDMSHLKEQTDD
jgi:hypothetical protein